MKRFYFNLIATTVVSILIATLLLSCSPPENGKTASKPKPPISDTNLLTLTPVVTGEEPFILTYSIPVDIDAAVIAYLRDNSTAHRPWPDLLDNGEHAYAYGFIRQTNGTYLVKYNTTFAPFGQHALQVCLHYHAGYARIYGPKRTEYVTNLVQFDPGTESFGSQMWFHGFLHIPSADYKIDIFDTNKTLLKTIAGHTEKGVIDEIWNLKTSDGQTRKDEEFASELFITPTAMDTNGYMKSNAPTVRIPYP